MTRFTVGPTQGGLRADKFVAAECPGASRRTLSTLFDDGAVRVNGKTAKKGQVLGVGDVVELAALPASPDTLRPVPQPELPLVVLYEDARLVALAKPPRMPSHPLLAGELGTLANALVARYPECAAAGADPREAGLAHRLDGGTSGVLVAARDRAAWDALRAAFHEGRARKEYLALVVGVVSRPGEIDLPIAHDRQSGGGVVKVYEDPDEASRRGALPARTSWTVERRFRDFTLLRCVAQTGRMHQIRVHLAHLGTPVVGDTTYGVVVGNAPDVAGHFLHAARLEIPHPDAPDDPARKLVVEAPLPPDREAALAQCAASS